MSDQGVTESKYFKEQKARNLNATVNGSAAWQYDVKYQTQVRDVLARVQADINDGIILHLQAKRMQYLEKHVAEKCYKNNDYTYLQAAKCEQHYYNNDFKLNLLESFVQESMVPHLREYQGCFTEPAFTRAATAEEKDRVFLACHNRWTSNLRTNVSQELEVKARELFQ